MLTESAKQGGQLTLGLLIEYSWYEVVLNNSITLKRDYLLAVEVRSVSLESLDFSFNVELMVESVVFRSL